MRILLPILMLAVLSGCSTGMITGGDQYEPEPRTEGVAAADSATTERVRRRINDDPSLANYRIGVTTYKGRVTLSGSVSNYLERNRAEELAKDVSGAKTINNQIVVDD